MRQFGTKEPGRDYSDRLGAFGIALNADGELLVARNPRGLVLPGGAPEEGETLEQALVREFLEETGYEVAAGERLGAARQYDAREQSAYNKECHFFRVRIVEKRGAPLESDHVPLWMTASEAELNLKEEASRWAVAQWARSPHAM